MIEFVFSERPIERRVELSPSFMRLAILAIMGKYPKQNFSVIQIQAYLWGFLSQDNMQKLSLLNKYKAIDVIPLYDVPELDGIIGELCINQFIQMKGAKFHITSVGHHLMVLLKNEDLLIDLDKSISSIGHLSESALNKINLSLNYAEFL